MTATDELRKLLDERGVKWTANESEYRKETCWTYMGELTAVFTEYYDGTERFYCDTWCFTPEQAIAATLGTGECAMIPSFTEPGTLNYCQEFCCSACGEYMVLQQFPECVGDTPNYCPNCGKAVKR